MLGERWSLLIIREIFSGRHRFTEIRSALGVASNLKARPMNLEEFEAAVTDQHFFATVTVGPPNRRRLVFVPLKAATVGPGYLKIAYDKSVVKRAPAIDTDE